MLHSRRENELLRYESVLAGKDREISDMKEAAEITADKLRHADNTLQARQQDISELQTVIEELKAQHVCTVKRFSFEPPFSPVSLFISGFVIQSRGKRSWFTRRF